jgi:hypothetical protein
MNEIDVLQEIRLQHNKTTHQLAGFSEYHTANFLNTDYDYISEVLGVDFREQVYSHPLAMEYSKQSKLCKNWWFIGDEMHNLVYDCSFGKITREECDRKLIDIYLDFLWYRRYR